MSGEGKKLTLLFILFFPLFIVWVFPLLGQLDQTSRLYSILIVGYVRFAIALGIYLALYFLVVRIIKMLKQ